MRVIEWPPWIDATSRLIAETYSDRIWAGDEEAINEAVAFAVTARDIRTTPDASGESS